MKSALVLLVAAPVFFAGCAGGGRSLGGGTHEKIVTHLIQPGETWESIARDFYRNEEHAGALAAFNGEDASVPPEAGSAVRVPLSRGDLDRLERRLEAAAAYNGGVELASRGDYGEAIEQFRRALAVDPQMTEASFNLAVTYQKLGLNGEAIPILEELVGRVPQSAEYQFALGHSCFREGDFERAKRAFVRALELDPAHRGALFSLAVVLEKLGEVDEAVLRWRAYLELDPGSEWAAQARSHLDALTRNPKR